MRLAEQARDRIRDAVRNAIAYYGFDAGETPELRSIARQKAREIGAAVTDMEINRLVKEATG